MIYILEYKNSRSKYRCSTVYNLESSEMLASKDIGLDRHSEDVGLCDNLQVVADGTNARLPLHANSNGVQLQAELRLHPSCHLVVKVNEKLRAHPVH